MKLAIIVAIAKNRVIGRNGQLPWHLSEDLKRFKKLTMGHTILMGRKTYESIGKRLPGRRNVVVTSRPIADVECYTSVNDALTALRDQETVFVIGGARMFAAALPLASHLYLTLLNDNFEGDAFFPDVLQTLDRDFVLTAKEERPGFVFADYERKPPR